MSIEEIKALVHRFVEEIWNRGNLDLLDEFMASDAVYHNAGMPDITGKDAFKQVVMMYRTAFPDLHFTIEEVIVEGNTSAAHWASTGTHLGELMGIPPTCKKMAITGISMVHYRDGKIVEELARWNVLTLMEQLGVMPANEL